MSLEGRPEQQRNTSQPAAQKDSKTPAFLHGVPDHVLARMPLAVMPSQGIAFIRHEKEYYESNGQHWRTYKGRDKSETGTASASRRQERPQSAQTSTASSVDEPLLEQPRGLYGLGPNSYKPDSSAGEQKTQTETPGALPEVLTPGQEWRRSMRLITGDQRPAAKQKAA